MKDHYYEFPDASVARYYRANEKRVQYFVESEGQWVPSIFKDLDELKRSYCNPIQIHELPIAARPTNEN